MRYCFIVFILVFSFVSSVSARIITAGAVTQQVSVYENSFLDQGFEVIGKVRVKAPMQDQLYQKMQHKASSRGGDAVLNYRVLRSGDDNDREAGYSVGQENWPAAEGVVVRFKKQGGINQIDDTTLIPVLN